MTKKDLLLNEIEEISETLLDEVIDFVQFLKRKKSKESIELAIASESALKKDWDSEEENKAWESL